MELREQIARRMAHVTYANPAYPNHVYDEGWTGFMDAASECIRQMEWARSVGRSEGFNYAWTPNSMVTSAMLDSPTFPKARPLSLAPDSRPPTPPGSGPE